MEQHNLHYMLLRLIDQTLKTVPQLVLYLILKLYYDLIR
jgi:hypothetical protein